MNTSWNAYLLDRGKLDLLREKGKKLSTMKSEDVVKLRALGPVQVEAASNYRAKKRLFAILQSQEWWPQNILFIHVYRYLYVKNEVDNRYGEREKPDIGPAFEAAKEHELLRVAVT